MGVAVNRKPVRLYIDDGLDSFVPAFHCLHGQAVDEVHVDAAEARRAGAVEQRSRFFLGLVPVDGFLHDGVEVLHAHADPVKPERVEGVDLFLCRNPRIDLERDFCVWVELKAVRTHFVQAFDLWHGEVGRRTAAPVVLNHPFPVAECGRCEVQFLFDVVQKVSRDGRLFRDDHVAPAKGAALPAEGDVDVKGKALVRPAAGFGQRATVLGVAERGIPLRRGGVAGVARAGPVVALEDLRCYVWILCIQGSFVSSPRVSGRMNSCPGASIPHASIPLPHQPRPSPVLSTGPFRFDVSRAPLLGCRVLVGV